MTSLLQRLEQWVSYLIMRMAPVWYANQIIRAQPLNEYPTINPLTCRAEQWFDLQQSLKYSADSLFEGPSEWHTLARDISRLPQHKPLNRKISLLRLTGALNLPEKYANYTTLREISVSDNEVNNYETAEEFDSAGASLPKNLPLIYREWDGRVLLASLSQTDELLPLMRYAAIHKRDLSLTAELTIESIKPEPLERIRTKYWWFLLHKDSAQALSQLFHQCGFQATYTGPIPNSPEHAFFYTTKSNTRINRLILTLMTQHRSNQLTEFGRYLSQHKHGFRNH